MALTTSSAALCFLAMTPEFNEYKFRDKIAANTTGLLYRIGIVTEQKRIYYLPAKKLAGSESL